MAFIKDVFCAFPEFQITADQLLRIFSHESFGYTKEKLEKIGKIIASMEVESRPVCINFEQFWEKLDPGSCDIKPGPTNLFREASVPFRPSLSDRAKVWERAVKVINVTVGLYVIKKILQTKIQQNI